MNNITKIMLDTNKTKTTLIIYLILVIASGFLVLQANNMLRVLFDNLSLQDFGQFGLRLFVVVSFFTSIFAINLLCDFIMERFMWAGYENLKRSYFMKLLRSNYGFFTKEGAPKIWSDLASAAQGVSFFYSRIASVFVNTVMLIFYSILVFSIDFYAGLFTIVAVPFYLLSTLAAISKFYPLQDKRLKLSGELSNIANGVLEDVANTKTKNAYDFFVGRIADLLRKISGLLIKFRILNSYIESISDLITTIAPLVIIFVAMQFSDTLTIEAGTILVLYINIPLLLRGFRGYHAFYTNYQAHKMNFKKLKEYDSIPLEQSGDKIINTFESLHTKDVKVEFAGGRIISIPDFDVTKGEKIMLLGESGIGKSTIFYIIMGLIKDYEGCITINGINLKDIDIDSLRNVFGMAFQNTNVLPLTLDDNILMGANNANLEEIIKISNLSGQAASKAGEVLNNKILSGGEKSRLGLAQVLAKGSEVILLDETFSNLDEDMERQIIKSLLERYGDKTIICINHRSGSGVFFDRIIKFL